MSADTRILLAAFAITWFTGGEAVAKDAEGVAPKVVVCKQIKTAAQLQAMQNNLAAVYCLAKDIDASAIANFVPVGTAADPFTGRLYGNDHVIANLTISSSAAEIGLFGATSGATIQDLALVNARVTDMAVAYTGALVGSATASPSAPSTIARVFVSGQVRTLYYGGGIAGSIDHDVTLTQSWSAAKVIGSDSTSVGGVVGLVVADAIVQQSYATGPVTAGDGCDVGGAVGSNSGTVRHSFAVGPVRGGANCNAGGLAGADYAGSAVLLAYAAGPVTAGDDSNVGGLTGEQNNGTVTEGYSIGRVIGGGGATQVGGLLGAIFGSPVVTNAYWDTQTSGQAASGGGLGGGLMTSQFRAKSPPGFGSAWAITRKLSYPFLNDPDIDFTSPLATLVHDDRVFVFPPISQLDNSQYKTQPAHPGQASRAAAYTMIARAIGISDNVAELKNVKIDRYFWDDATQTTSWKGPVKTFAILGSLKPIATATTLDATNVIGRMDQQKLVILRGAYTQPGGGTATHFMLGTLYTRSAGKVAAVVANDPRTGGQVSIDPTSKKVVAPANFRLADFKVNGYQPVTLTLPLSDIRLKRDIVKLARLDNGLGLYRYRYVWDDDAYVGVMAQEVAEVIPSAAVVGPDGYLRVDYSQLGLRLQTWKEWLLTRGGGGLPLPPH